MADGHKLQVWQSTTSHPESTTCNHIPRIHWGTWTKFKKAGYIERCDGKSAAREYVITVAGREALKQ